MQKPAYEYHETLWFGSSLALIGGFLDAYTYILHGGVFANAQTGNIVLIAISGAGGKWFDTVKFLYPISTFIAGILVSEVFKSRNISLFGRAWVYLVLVLEAIILIVIGFLPAAVPDIVVTSVVSFLAGVQVSSFKKLRDSPYSTTMVTGNIRSFVELAYRAIRNKNHDAAQQARGYLIIIVAFTLGATCGGVLCYVLKLKAIWVCAAALVAVLIVLEISGRLIEIHDTADTESHGRKSGKRT